MYYNNSHKKAISIDNLPVTATGIVNKAIIKWDQSMKTGQSVGQFDQLLLLVLSIKLKL